MYHVISWFPEFHCCQLKICSTFLGVYWDKTHTTVQHIAITFAAVVPSIPISAEKIGDVYFTTSSNPQFLSLTQNTKKCLCTVSRI